MVLALSYYWLLLEERQEDSTGEVSVTSAGMGITDPGSRENLDPAANKVNCGSTERTVN